MCGIAGVFGRAILNNTARVGRVFGDALAHRGPDGEGFLLIPIDERRPYVARSRQQLDQAGPVRGIFVHRRLSIIDLKTGDQPMQFADEGCWIVFNGEIYNYRELRNELQRTAHARFRTDSDTEVILAVYNNWGIKGFARLNGIYAFAIYDARHRELILARDPVGVKPLYWTVQRNSIGFASEIRPLVTVGMANDEPD